MIDACRPILPLLKPIGPAEVLCVKGYRDKIAIYDAVLIGAAAGGGDVALRRANELLWRCDYAQLSPADNDQKSGANRLKWVGLCVKPDPTKPFIAEAVLALSSGDAALDEEMVTGAVGLALPAHWQHEKWAGLRMARPTEGIEFGASDEPELPDLDCDRLNVPGG